MRPATIKDRNMPGSELDMMKPDNTKLILTLDGAVLTSDKFIKAVTNFFRVLDNVSDEATKTNDAVDWLVRAKEGSTIIEAVPIAKNIAPSSIDFAVVAVMSGLEELENGVKERPRYFNDTAMNAVRSLSEMSDSELLLKVSGGGILAKRITTQTKASVDSVLEAKYTDYGTVEGYLGAYSAWQGQAKQFSIKDDLTDNKVTCYTSNSSLLDSLKNAVERRVSVWGRVRYRKDGVPVNILVEGVRVFRTKDELPSINDMIGILGGPV